jgi:glutamyl-Q tRNA(Asp) synthetase
VYVGRFAPSPSGPLHEGSLVVALASYLDARVARGKWLVRIEDVDTVRTVHGAQEIILAQLCAFGMTCDDEVSYQSKRFGQYQAAFDSLLKAGLAYPCGCSRREIADSVLESHGQFPDGERPYPGICRAGLSPGKSAKSWRFRVPAGNVSFHDRWLGEQTQNVRQQIGDFVIKRADGVWAYQLAVVIDDAEQGVTHIVRGQDLLSSTARQRLLAKALGLISPEVMHVPLVMDEHGLKLSKQNGAQPVDTSSPLKSLLSAYRHLGMEELQVNTLEQFWSEAKVRWSGRFKPD